MIYTIELTEAENKALGVIAYDQLEWITNAVKERCRVAIDEIVNQEVQRKLAAGEPITGSKDDIVIQADIKSAKEKQAEYESQLSPTPE